MPRDLTDLMERATSSAPPETHHAADITRLAAQRQRRRTSGIVAGLAAAAIVAAAAGYGATRHDSTPEPAGPYKYDQRLDVSDAVRARTLPGYRLEPWTIPSVEDDLGPHGPWPTYHDVDADGRMVVEDFPGGVNGPPRIRLYDAPGAAPHVLRQPSRPPDYRGPAQDWAPSFLGDGRLVWTAPAVTGFHVTDLDGRHDVFVKATFTKNHGRVHFSGGPGQDGSAIWGDRWWFKVSDHSLPHFQGTAFDLYTATFAGHPKRIAENVADFAVGGGRVAWVTTTGKVVTESVSGGSPHTVDVPLDPGCRVPVLDLETLAPMFSVGRSALALAEACGTGRSQTYVLVAFDLSGRRLARIDGGLPFGLSITGDTLLFISGAKDIQVMRYDFVTGDLSRWGVTGKRGLSDPQGAGDYVLWYDREGGHVARIPQ